jgi:hypothetical protein
MRSLLISFAVVLAPSVALAQGVCPNGLVAADAAHCCWPGQSFSAERQSCAGAPQCPPGMVAYGETCALAPTYVPPPPPPPSAYGVPATAMGPRYRAHFEAKKDHKFTVVMDTGESCETPCDLGVSVGRHKVKIEGDATFSESLSFPAAPSVVKIEKRRGIVGLGVAGLAAGIPVAVVGLAVALTGALFNDMRNGTLYSSGYPNRRTTNDMIVVGGTMAAVGVTFAAVGGGVGLGLAGHNRAKLEKAPEQPKDERASLVLTGLGVAPTQGGAVVGASFAF